VIVILFLSTNRYASRQSYIALSAYISIEVSR